MTPALKLLLLRPRGTPDVVGDLAGWSYRQAVTLDNAAGPALADYQVPVPFDSSSFDFSQALATGADLRVTASNGTTLLSHWVEWFDPAGLTGRVWVKVPSIAAGGSRTLYLYAGNSGASSASSFDAVFQKLAAEANTLALYHCDDGSGSSLAEASAGTAGVVTNGSWAAGAGGGWGAFGTANGFTSGNTITLSGTGSSIRVTGLLDTPPSQGTVSLWFKFAAAPVDGCRLFSKRTSNDNGFEAFISSGVVNVRTTRAGGTETATAIGHTPVVAGQWHHICATWGSVTRLLMDGRLEDEAGGVSPDKQGNVWPSTGTPYPFTLGASVDSSGVLGNRAAASFSEVEVLNRQVLPEDHRRRLHRAAYARGVEEGGRWDQAPRTVVMAASVDVPIYQEATVIRLSSSDYRLFLSGASGGVSLWQAGTSADGLSWTPVGPTGENFGSCSQSCCVVKPGGGYRWYMSDGYVATTNVRYYDDADGVFPAGLTFADATVCVTGGSGGVPITCSNNYVWWEDAGGGNYNWFMLLEASDDVTAASNTYNVHLLTSPDGIAWTLNPAGALKSLLMWPEGSASGPSKVIQSGGYYHLLTHNSTRGFGPSSICHSRSTNLVDWELLGRGDSVLLVRTESTAGGPCDQLADPDWLDLTTEIRTYYESVRNVGASGQDGEGIVAARFTGTMAQLTAESPAVTVAAATPPTLWTPASLTTHLKVWSEPRVSMPYFESGKYQRCTGKGDISAVVPGLSGTPDLTATLASRQGLRVGRDQQGRPYLLGVVSEATAMTFGDLSALFPTAATFGFAVWLDGSPVSHELFSTKPDTDGFFRYSGDGGGYPAAMRASRIDAYPASMPSSGYHVVVYESSGAGYTVHLDGVSQGAQAAGYDAGSAYIVGAGQHTGAGVVVPFHGRIYAAVGYDRINAGDRASLTTYLGSLVGLVL